MTSGYLSYYPANTTSAENDAILKDPNLSYTLVYFELTSVGAIPRDVLAISGKPWKNEIIPDTSNWKENLPTPFQCLPVLHIHKEGSPDIILSESIVVDQYLAGVAGLLGENEWEGQVIRALHSSVLWFRETFYEQVARPPTHASKVKALYDRFLPTTLPKWLDAIDFHLKENAQRHSGGYLMGNKLSLADVAVANMLDYFAQHPPMFSEPVLKAVRERPRVMGLWVLVTQEPRLAQWRASDEYKRLAKSSDPDSKFMARLL